MSNQSFTIVEKSLAWSVHIFTASGLIAAFMAILEINEQDWRMAMFWLLICQVIDGIDGTFARMFRVKEVLPYMDGQTIDYVIDFASYAIIPAYFFYEAGLVDEQWNLACTSLILLVSALYYGKTGMVTDDYYFLGFPVMWNMVVFYLVFVFAFPSLINILIVVFFAILHFVPIKFVYPSRNARFKNLTIGITIAFILSMLAIIWFYPEQLFYLRVISLACVVYYGLMAIYNTWFE